MPWAMQTKPGWILSGPLLQQGTANVATEVLVAAQVDPLADQVKIYCSVSGRSKEDDKAPEMLEATTKFEGERYEHVLIRKNATLHLPNNYSSALSQLKSLERRLEKNENLRQRNQENIDVDVRKGFVRILDETDLENTRKDLKWFVPHLSVLNPKKTDKVRRCLMFGGVSLDDNLMAGSDIQQSPIGIIFRFREKQTALNVDVEAMFLKVKVP